MKIAVVDYGSGNLRSVYQAIKKVAPLNSDVWVTEEPNKVKEADRVIFPGQGAMPDCMANLRKAGLEEAVRDSLKKKPFFAVCVGEQMLFDFSEEGDVPALGIFPGRVVRFPANQYGEDGSRLKVPQMGWNRVRKTMVHYMWEGIPDNSWFYFVHSYYVVPADLSLIAGTTDYGRKVTVAVAKDYIFATQFHPEKSADMGLKLYSNFLTWKP